MDVSLALLDSRCRRCCLDLAGMHQQSIFFKPEVISMDQHGNFDRDNDFKPATDFGFGPCFGQNHIPLWRRFFRFPQLGLFSDSEGTTMAWPEVWKYIPKKIEHVSEDVVNR